MIKIRVTKEIMRRSKTWNKCHCAIAEAVRPYFPDRHIAVGHAQIKIFDRHTNDLLQRCDTPEPVYKFLCKFDYFATGAEAAAALDEVEFELDLEPECVPEEK